MRFFGTPEGVHDGQFFVDRQHLRDANLHMPLQSGISGTAAEGADSIVVSGGYADDEDHGDYLIYTGHGGNDRTTKRQVRDQSPDAPGNAGLITSMVRGLPVRVIRGPHKTSPWATRKGYIYSGLYLVTQWWIAHGDDGFVIVRYRLERLEGQQALIAPTEVELEPIFREALVSRRVRDSAISREVKSWYDDHCQLCDARVPAFGDRFYSEGAHVRPVGRPHLGADDAANLLCLCPNHHTQLDYGGLLLSESFEAFDSHTTRKVGEVRFKRSHLLSLANVRYHQAMWSSGVPQPGVAPAEDVA